MASKIAVIKLSFIVFVLVLLTQCGKKKDPDITNIVDDTHVYTDLELGFNDGRIICDEGVGIHEKE